ncbi:PAAR domain-containing protein [Serratia quinivorans]|uniref:PAAR domain-containing protein n=1 Tax=Serratia quinivorans TaxID=137545 RepID=UPI003F98F159
MSELSAARELDEIAHTASEGWMIAGLIGGAIVGAALIAVTGGTAAVAVAAVVAGASAGGGLGEVLGSMSWAPRHVTGLLTDGSPNVYINGRPAIRAHISTGECSEDGPAKKVVAQGSAKVYINDFPAARINDLLACSAEIHIGSPNVIIGGEKEQTDDIEPEIPDWVNWTLLAAGVAATAVLAGPAIAIMSAAGGMIGGTAGDYVGGVWFGEGSDGQKWIALGGAFAGGFAGARSGPKVGEKANNIIYKKTNGIPIRENEFNKILGTEKGGRPAPESYLSNRYIKNHLKDFDKGATRLVTKRDYIKYGLGKPDELKSEFVSSSKGMNKIISESKGNTKLLSDRLGVSKEQLDNGEMLRVDFYPTNKYSPQLPTGNEFGANPQWLPGGRLPKGDPEAIISMKDLKKGVDYEVFDFKTGEIHE